MDHTASLAMLLALLVAGTSVKAGCQKGVALFECMPNPCDEATCPAYPLAQCRLNHCGSQGCFIVFYLQSVQVDCSDKR